MNNHAGYEYEPIPCSNCGEPIIKGQRICRTCKERRIRTKYIWCRCGDECHSGRPCREPHIVIGGPGPEICDCVSCSCPECAVGIVLRNETLDLLKTASDKGCKVCRLVLDSVAEGNVLRQIRRPITARPKQGWPEK